MRQETLQTFANSIARKYGAPRADKILFANISRPKIKHNTWHYVNASGNVLYSRYLGVHFNPKWRRGVSYVAAFCEVTFPHYYRRFFVE